MEVRRRSVADVRKVEVEEEVRLRMKLRLRLRLKLGFWSEVEVMFSR